VSNLPRSGGGVLCMLNVLITGANSGFGLLTARKFAEAGHTVHAGFRSKDRAGDLETLALELPKIRPVRLDVTDQSSIDQAVGSARRTAPIDVLINNAGFELACPVEQLSDELLSRQFDTNVLGVVRMVRAVAPEMRARRSGMLINLSSVVGWVTFPYTSAYAASKHAVEALSEGLWLEMAPFGIRVAVVEPGAFPTSFDANVITAPDFNDASPHWANARRYRAALRSIIEEGRADADPQEVADLVFDAATSNEPRFRYVAGADARAVIPAYKSMEFEAFQGAVLARMGLTEWALEPEHHA
jgi:NAD(P)-dependent dehydrogenase (short-subunit alcohol dehydrogenase family)